MLELWVVELGKHSMGWIGVGVERYVIGTFGKTQLRTGLRTASFGQGIWIDFLHCSRVVDKENVVHR